MNIFQFYQYEICTVILQLILQIAYVDFCLRIIYNFRQKLYKTYSRKSFGSVFRNCTNIPSMFTKEILQRCSSEISNHKTADVFNSRLQQTEQNELTKSQHKCFLHNLDLCIQVSKFLMKICFLIKKYTCCVFVLASNGTIFFEIWQLGVFGVQFEQFLEWATPKFTQYQIFSALDVKYMYNIILSLILPRFR